MADETDSSRTRPLGAPVPDHTPGPIPTHTTLVGQYITVTALLPSHAAPLFPYLSGPSNAPLWDYMFAGPFESSPAALSAFTAHIASCSTSTDPLFFAILDNTTASPVGMFSLMRIDATHRVLEIGHIMYTPLLQRTRGATEAMYLLLRHAFDELGYRRVEWKCHALNAGSRRAAARYGFVFEGVFRRHMVVKGRNRDTWWASMVREDWVGGCQKGFERWLAKENFDAQGRQRKTLEGCRADAVETR